MVIYCLLFTVLALLLLNLIMFEGEVLSPPVIMCAGFFMSILCAIYNIDYWRISLHWNTYWVITLGLVSFSIVGIFIKAVFTMRARAYSASIQKQKHSNYGPKPIKVDNTIVWIMIFAAIIVCVLYYSEIVRITGGFGHGQTWSQMMNKFRADVSYGKSDEKVSFFIRNARSIFIYLGYVCVYILVFNYYTIRRCNKALFILCILTILMVFLDAGREEFLAYIIAGITFLDCFIYRKTGKSIKVSIKFLFIVLISTIGFFTLFVWLKQIVGRTDNLDPIYYITFYVGGPIENLDIFLQEKRGNPGIWGKETFYALNQFFGHFVDNPNYTYIAHKEFQSSNGINTGNVYTVFRAYIHDFGYSGMAVLTIIMSGIINTLYVQSKLKIPKKSNYFDGTLLTYGYLMQSIYLAFFVDYFYSRVLSTGFLKMLIGFYVGHFVLTRMRVRVAGSYISKPKRR